MPVGIDLGTAFSTIALTNERGVPRLVGDSRDSSRHRTPSVVTLLADSVIVGRDCVDEVSDDGAVTTRELKELLGGGGNTVVGPSGRRWTGEELCALVLRKLLHDAGAVKGGEIVPMVLTAPARFTDTQRRSLRSAAAIAGLPGCRIVEDAVACAALHPPGRDLGDEVVLVCDAGYAGFAASLVATCPSGLYVVANQFTPLAGTRAMDRAIGGIFDRQFEAIHGASTGPEPKSVRAWEQIGEQFRRELSQTGGPVASRVSLIDGRIIDRVLSRSQLERVLGPALDAAEATIEDCLAGAALPRSAVQRVVLAGGGAHTTALRRRAALVTGRRAEVLRGIEPEHIAALGAAALGALRQPAAGGDGFVVRQAAPFDLGFRVLEGSSESAGPEFVIAKNTALPVLRSTTIHCSRPNRESIDVELVQRDGPDDPGVGVGVATFGPLKCPAAGLSVEIRLGYDSEGFVVVSSNDRHSGRIIAQAQDHDLAPEEEPDPWGQFARQVAIDY